jgi:hypothetical protein
VNQPIDRVAAVVNPRKSTRAPTSLRSSLAVALILTLSAVISAALASQLFLSASIAQAGTDAMSPGPAQNVELNYRPSQPTGWETPYTPTLGGYTPSKHFDYRGQAYRISLLPFGQAGSAANPVYEGVPADPNVKFSKTLDRAWGRYYSFRYLGGLSAGAKFTVESYGVWSGKPRMRRTAGAVAYGPDVYFVYQPGGQSDPAINSDLQFIQILYNKEGKGGDLLPAGISRQVDSERHNPFYGEGGGLTSIDGNQIVNFSDFIHLATDAKTLPSNRFIAETFLAQDTGIKDSAGKDIVNIFGGMKWGWQLQRAS